MRAAGCCQHSSAPERLVQAIVGLFARSAVMMEENAKKSRFHVTSDDASAASKDGV
jgi:hypothetical protein